MSSVPLPHPHHRHAHRQGAQHQRDGGLFGVGPQRHGGLLCGGQIRDRMAQFMAAQNGVEAEVRFTPEGVVAGDAVCLSALARMAYLARVSCGPAVSMPRPTSL
jgi:hypothetical protein